MEDRAGLHFQKQFEMWTPDHSTHSHFSSFHLRWTWVVDSVSGCCSYMAFTLLGKVLICICRCPTLHDALMNCVYQQRFSKVSQSPSSNIIYTIVSHQSVFNAVLPVGSKLPLLDVWIICPCGFFTQRWTSPQHCCEPFKDAPFIPNHSSINW